MLAKLLEDDLILQENYIEAAGEDPLDLLLEPPVRGPVGYVSLGGSTRAACEQGDNAARSVKDDGARISRGGEGAALPVVGQDGGLDGRAHDAVLTLDASERVQSIDPADGSPRGQTYLLVVHMEVLWLTNLMVLDDAEGLNGKTETAGPRGVGKKRTNVDLVSREGGPVYLLLVELDKGPVTGKPVGFVGDRDGLRVKDTANNALVRVGPELGNLVVELVQGVDPPGCFLHLALGLRLPCGVGHIRAVDGLTQPLDLPLPHGDGASKVADSSHHGRDDLLAGLTATLGRHACIGKQGRRASNVGSGEEGDAVVITAEAEVEPYGTRRWGVSEGIHRKELWATHRAHHLRLAESDLNLREASLAQDVLDSIGGSHGSLKGKCLVLHTDPHQERAKRRLLPSVSKGNGIDRGPLDVESIEGLEDVGTNLEPVVCDGMIIHRAELTDVALCLGTLVFRPSRT
ncbi:unnamed protein product [Tuber aestivum]|uniref:Uncharacterized protein n=1 Tax=Tuber aestivum TaxID=59557 RepID=A0A292PWF9_9PEZI|nr:unnamed protein product [Tuber aestivum]